MCPPPFTHTKTTCTCTRSSRVPVLNHTFTHTCTYARMHVYSIHTQHSLSQSHTSRGELVLSPAPSTHLPFLPHMPAWLGLHAPYESGPPVNAAHIDDHRILGMPQRCLVTTCLCMVSCNSCAEKYINHYRIIIPPLRRCKNSEFGFPFEAF